MKNILFQTAVLLAINQVRENQNKFSVHDVTKFLRSLVNDGTIAFSDKGLEVIDGVSTYRVGHAEVKAIFQDLYESGVLKDLSKSYNPAGFIEYENTNAISLAPAKAKTVQPTIPQLQVSTVTTQVSTDADLLNKLRDYLAAKRGETITVKQIQSRFKGVYKTCAEYIALLKANGITVYNDVSPMPSKNYVLA